MVVDDQSLGCAMHSSRLGSSRGACVIMLSLTHWQRGSKKAGGDVPNHKFNCRSGIENMEYSTAMVRAYCPAHARHLASSLRRPDRQGLCKRRSHDRNERSLSTHIPQRIAERPASVPRIRRLKVTATKSGQHREYK